MNKFVTEAIILKNLNYGDSHKFYSMLTRDHGKISALAMGVRKISSRRAGNLDTLNYVTVSISESSKGFKTIDEVKTLNSFKYSKGSLDKIYYGLKFAEAAEFTIEPEHYVPEIFYLLLNTLNFLETGDTNLILLEAWFLLNLCDQLGFRIDLDRCVNCGSRFQPSLENISYNYDAGGLLCPSCSGFYSKLNPTSIHLLKRLRDGGPQDLPEIPSQISNEVLTILNTHSQNLYGSRRSKKDISLI